MYSAIIKNGTVIDGSGNQPYKADIAIQDDRIVEIGTSLNSNALTAIDASELIVAPGFIDIHTHTDNSIFKNNMAPSKLLQGVTSDVTGNCGLGCFPTNSKHLNILEDFLKMDRYTFPKEGLCWNNFADYAKRLETESLGINLIPLISHGALRIAAMGADDRHPTETEQATMNELLATGLKQGAWGMSSGLIYPPSSFANTAELIELAKVLANHKALYASHIRNESTDLLEAVEEAITIGKESGAKIEISHLKAIGQPNWGKGERALRMINTARAIGIDIGADQYPYEASSTSLTALTPQWAQAGGVNELISRLSDPTQHTPLVDAIHKEMSIRGGPDRVMIVAVNSQQNAKFIGKTILQISQSCNCSPEETVLQLLREENAAVTAVYFSISEKDVEAIITSKYVAVGSDGKGLDAQKDSNEAQHPRNYGTFPRVLGHFVREKKLLDLQTAIYKMTGLPAERLRMKDRGLLQVGMYADITIFNAATISDKADFTNPHQYPTGIDYVLVNGKLAVKHGSLTGTAAGRVLHKI